MNSSVQVAIIFSAFATGFHLQNLCTNGSLFALESQIMNPGELVWYIKKYIWSLFLIPIDPAPQMNSSDYTKNVNIS